MPPLKVRKVGNSLAIILTMPAQAALGGVKVGDMLSAIVGPDRQLTLTAYDSEFEAQMNLADDVMHRRRNVLRELAK